MTKDVVTIDSLATVAQAVELMQQQVEQTNIDDTYSIVTETNIIQKVIKLGENPRHFYVNQIITKPRIIVNLNLFVEHFSCPNNSKTAFKNYLSNVYLATKQLFRTISNVLNA